MESKEALFRLFVAFSASYAVLSAFHALFRIYFMHNFLSWAMSTEVPDFGPLLSFSCAVFLPLTAVIFYLSFRMDLGFPRNEFTPLSLVFEDPGLFSARILSGRYSLKRVVLFAFILSIVFSLAGSMGDFVYLLSAPGLSELEGVLTSEMPSFFGYLESLSFVGPFLGFFSLAFFFYWGLAFMGKNIPYSDLLALMVSFSLVPLAFLAASVLVDLASYLALGSISHLNLVFFPYMGWLLFYYLTYSALKVLLHPPWKAVLLAAPFFLMVFFSIYLAYLAYYVFPGQVLEANLYMLGVLG